MVTVVRKAETKNTNCGVCKSLLEYDFKDVTASLERDYGGGSDMVYRILCPSCQNRVVVGRW